MSASSDKSILEEHQDSCSVAAIYDALQNVSFLMLGQLNFHFSDYGQYLGNETWEELASDNVHDTDQPSVCSHFPNYRIYFSVLISLDIPLCKL